MKLILFYGFLGLILTSTGCSTQSSSPNRSPGSVSIPVSQKGNKEKEKGSTVIENYFSYFLIRNQSFAKLDRLDCKALILQNQSFCSTETCKALITEQDFRCTDEGCKAIVNSREDQCPDETCKAIVTNQSDKCKSDDNLCNLIITKDDGRCGDNQDCKAFVQKSASLCQSEQCKAILNDNFTYCLERTP